MDIWEFKRQPLLIPEDESPVINISDFDYETARELITRLAELESDQSLDVIFINVFSYGGELYPLLAMVDAVKNSEKEVHIVGLGSIFSAGADFLALGPVGNRWMGENCFMHIHHTETTVCGSLKQIRQELSSLELAEKKVLDLLVENSKISRSKLSEELEKNNGEWTLTAEEAKEYGFIDHIGTPRISRYEVWEYTGV